MDNLDYLRVLDYPFVSKLASLGAGFLRWEIVEIYVQYYVLVADVLFPLVVHG